MLELRIVNMIFHVKRPVLSLPSWHGGRWSAWFREACKPLPFKFDELALAIYPERFGQKGLKPAEKIAVRMLLPRAPSNNLSEFAAQLLNTYSEGEFSAASLRLDQIRDFRSGAILWKDGKETGNLPSLFSERLLTDEISALQSLSRFSLVFKGPLRLAAPSGQKDKSSEILKYCQPDRLIKEARLIYHLVRHVRFLDEADMSLDAPENLAADLAASKLRWHDMRYNSMRQMALGGICGKLVLNGKASRSLARLLVLGQYLGAGKNGRFGFGFWQIPEIQLSGAPRDL